MLPLYFGSKDLFERKVLFNISANDIRRMLIINACISNTLCDTEDLIFWSSNLVFSLNDNGKKYVHNIFFNRLLIFTGF